MSKGKFIPIATDADCGPVGQLERVAATAAAALLLGFLAYMLKQYIWH